MTKFFLWTGRILFAAAVILIVAAGVFFTRFSAHRNQSISALEHNSRIVQTTAGEVEVVTLGKPDAPAVLVLHGTPGGYDQALAMGRSFADDGILIIAPSRPGYLRTPLVDGFLFSEQADVMVALMDALNIHDASVVGLAAGALVGAEMAIRHPGRVRGLVMISPPTAPLPAVASGTFGGINFFGAQVMSVVGGDLGAYFLVRDWENDPVGTAGRLLRMDTSTDDAGDVAKIIVSDPAQRELFDGIVQSLFPLSPRESGARNDLLHLRHPQPINFSSITCPVLILSGSEDHARDVANPALVEDAAPDAKSEVIDGAGSMVWFGPGGAVVPGIIREFIQNLPPPLPAE